MDNFTQAVLERDGERCFNPNCKRDVKKDWRYSVFDAIHFYPKGQLGKDDPMRTDPKNGAIGCRYCHDQIHFKTKDEVRGYMFLKGILDWYEKNRPETYKQNGWKQAHIIINGLAEKQSMRKK